MDNMKRKPQEDIRDRARASGMFFRCDDERMEDDAAKMAAFMSIFHPEVNEKRVHSMISDIRKRKER